MKSLPLKPGKLNNNQKIKLKKEIYHLCDSYVNFKASKCGKFDFQMI